MKPNANAVFCGWRSREVAQDRSHIKTDTWFRCPGCRARCCHSLCWLPWVTGAATGQDRGDCSAGLFQHTPSELRVPWSSLSCQGEGLLTLTLGCARILCPFPFLEDTVFTFCQSVCLHPPEREAHSLSSCGTPASDWLHVAPCSPLSQSPGSGSQGVIGRA